MKYRRLIAAFVTAFLSAAAFGAYAYAQQPPEDTLQQAAYTSEEIVWSEAGLTDDSSIQQTADETGEEEMIVQNDYDIQEAENISFEAGWNEHPNGGKCYLSETGEMLTGYNVIDGSEYYFAANGKAKSGFYTINGVRMYFSPENYQRVYGWVESCGESYYLDEEGKAAGMREIDSRKYYFDEYGICKTGWIEYDGSKYYSTMGSGLLTGECEIDGEKYFFSSKGRFVSGWLTVDGKRVYYDYETAKPMYGFIKYNDCIYYCDEEEGKLTGDCEIEGKMYRFDENGCQQTGFQKFSDGSRYYTEDGRPKSGFVTIDKNKYYFSESNYLMQKGIITVNGKKYFMNSSGIMQTGWQTVSGSRYYFSESGEMVTDRIIEYQGSCYALGSDGKMVKGWYNKNNQKRYFGTDGKMLTGLQTISGKKYLFSDSDNYWYTGGSKGVLITDVPHYYDSFKGKDGKYYETVYRIDKNGVVTTEDDLLDKVKGSSKRYFDVENKQGGSSWTSSISDSDVSTLKKFAEKYFTNTMTGAQKLRTTLEWIHSQVQYARGSDWDEISSCSFVDAIFNHRKGQCAQYNGALIAMMNWLGYDSKLILGYRGYGDSKWQHFWGEVRINGTIYIMETGNEGSDGGWQHFLTELEYASGYIY